MVVKCTRTHKFHKEVCVFLCGKSVCLSVHLPHFFSSVDRGVRQALSKAPHVLFGQACGEFCPINFLSPRLMKSWNILFSW